MDTKISIYLEYFHKTDIEYFTIHVNLLNIRRAF